MPHEPAEAKIFTCTQSQYLAEEIAAAYGVKLGNVITSTYSDGSFNLPMRSPSEEPVFLLLGQRILVQKT
jgi:phosphoribosylpyrophosphate synthetase